MSKYKIVYRDANPSWQELCPVRVLAVQVSRDTETGACFLQTKIANVSSKPVSRIELTVGLGAREGRRRPSTSRSSMPTCPQARYSGPRR